MPSVVARSSPLPPLAIVSPHRDDAAFSCGALLLALAAREADVTIVNVFTRSGYAPYSAATDANEVSAMRRAEDEALLTLLATHGRAPKLLDLDLLDAPLRLDLDPLAPVSAELTQREAERLAPSLPLADFALVLGPSGVGKHIDHVVVREAMRRAVPDAVRGSYEDQPYAARSTASFEANASLRSFADAKSSLANVYASQVAAEVGVEIAAFARAHGERYRLPPRSALRSLLRETP